MNLLLKVNDNFFALPNFSRGTKISFHDTLWNWVYFFSATITHTPFNNSTHHRFVRNQMLSHQIIVQLCSEWSCAKRIFVAAKFAHTQLHAFRFGRRFNLIMESQNFCFFLLSFEKHFNSENDAYSVITSFLFFSFLIFVNFIHYMMAIPLLLLLAYHVNWLFFPLKARTHTHTHASIRKESTEWNERKSVIHSTMIVVLFSSTIIKTENESLLGLTPT